MKIRSITLFADLALPIDRDEVKALGEAAQAASAAYTAAGYEVQTIRLATNLLSSRTPIPDPVQTAVTLEATCQDAGFEFLSLGPCKSELLPWVPDILRATKNTFVTCHIVEPRTDRIDGDGIGRATEVIRAAAGIDAGFGNLRFAALADVPPGIPFFPAAYTEATMATPSFAVATQSADLAVRATSEFDTGEMAHARLRDLVESHGQRIDATAGEIAANQEMHYLGTDFSLAPFPGAEDSIGGALEALTGYTLGSPGTLAAAAALTSAVQEARFRHTGFCGLMMPVLEDSVLAQRAAEGRLRISDLLQWSAVCGTGLDTVPIPGNAGSQAIASLLFDVAALAVRLDKPLTARLMPLPGKVAGDPVHFDFAYFADGGVLPLGESAVRPPITASGLALKPYHTGHTWRADDGA